MNWKQRFHRIINTLDMNSMCHKDQYFKRKRASLENNKKTPMKSTLDQLDRYIYFPEL